MRNGVTETLHGKAQSPPLWLRSFRASDAAALQAICASWRVARMTSRIPHPYPRGAAARWIAEREELAMSGREISFCLDSDGTLAGAVTLRRLASACYELGYWIAEAWWGRGFATAAARHASTHAFAALGAVGVRAGHYLDNPASGRVLEKCGFRYTASDWQWCQARQRIVPCRRYLLQGAGAR